MDTLTRLPSSFEVLFDPSFSVKVVEVAKKYDEPEGKPIARTPEYTIPGGPNSYHCSEIDTAWTQGFLPGLIWLIVERHHLLPSSVESAYTEKDLIRLARRWQSDFEFLKRPSINHDQGFRFQLSFGKELELTGDHHAKEVLIEAAESLVDRYNEGAGCIRSWDQMMNTGNKSYTRQNMDEHYLVIIDNMMNLDLMYQATNLTGDPKYAQVATRQAEKSMNTHVRPNGTTYHVVNMDQRTGEALEFMTHQGYSDDSCWARGQAWGIYGYAQCALRTKRIDFLSTCRMLADVFLSLLPESGVPWWDFDAPKPCSYDASAATIAARGMQMLYQLLLSVDRFAAEKYLAAGFKLIKDTLRECASPMARLDAAGNVDWGKDGWETILTHSTSNGNAKATRRLMDHGLVYADYYLVEFGMSRSNCKSRRDPHETRRRHGTRA